MKLAGILVLLFLVPALAIAQDADEKKPAEKPDVKVAAWGDGKTAASPARRLLTISEARRQGFTLLSVKAAVEEAKEKGEIDRDMSHAEIAVVVAEKISARNNAKFDPATFDAILAFIEKILPLIMKLLGL